MDRILKAARTSGSLNLSNRSLLDVPTEVYQCLETTGEGENWWEAVDLQKLILAHNDIEVLREDLKNLACLVVLNVSHNKLSELPAAIGELTAMKSLDVSFNSISELPEQIGSAISLVKLDCSSNRLKELPESLGRCLDLSDLKASNNQISSLPEDMVNCSKLSKLDMEGNKLTVLSEKHIASWTMLTELNASKNILGCLPQNIGSLSRLIRLDLHQNKISSVPPSIGGCSSLVEFYLGINLLSTLPAEIGDLSRLGTLDLRSNQLKEYPVGACKLKLSYLDLSNNSLTGLYPELGNMITLRKLVLVGNPLRTLRSTLVNGPTAALLKYLRSRLSDSEETSASTPTKENVIASAARMSISSKELSLEGLNLSAVPAEVWESGEITKVNLSKNSIEELPAQLSSSVSLQTLILSRNKIKDWPGAILKSLPNLVCLKLDNNPLKQIPLDGFQAVSGLQILDLSGNAVFREHPKFCHLPQLQELYLSRIQLSEVPEDILNLSSLLILDLNQNSLQSIPKGIKSMTSLKHLDISNNNISSLPPELGLLEPTLEVLRLDGNPLRSIRRPILERGTKAVLNYLKDRLPDQ
ncbi:plant intracellular Ras-group-related LRR protein 6 [Capsella rubella]|uniref:plant intracellular Ras-group-related LRR protein 6 n=1 Tax=Capsella rubella TaxID=81985 RepID=UPI000CD4B728|nr:plant intracellular Ras-group-related LRR protein 6 [Capsella rubella]